MLARYMSSHYLMQPKELSQVGKVRLKCMTCCFILGCSSTCDDTKPCPVGTACVDNQCCTCSKEEFTLVLRNLTFEDSGRYKCQIANQSEQLEFQVEVLG